MPNRIEKAQALIAERDVSALVAAPGSDMAYLIGHHSHPSERPQMLVVPATGRPVIIIAGFESRALPDLGAGVEVATYSETENPYELVDEVTSAGCWRSVAVSDQAWAATVLGLQTRFATARFMKASPILRELRMIKDEEELALLRGAAGRADHALESFLQSGLAGLTELEAGDGLRRRLEEQGLTECGVIAAGGPNGASPHHHNGNRPIESGDLVVIDCGGRLGGYWADTTRTIAVGEPSAGARRAYDAVVSANQAAEQRVKPGITAHEVDSAARSIIESAGYGDDFIHRTGHGLGLDGHEEPYIVAGNDLKLEPGMTFSIEPGVYLQGDFGVRVEDIVAVTHIGVEILNKTSKDLMVVA